MTTEYYKNWLKENPEKRKLYKQRAYNKNPEHYRRKQIEWRNNNPERYMQTYLRGQARVRAKSQNVPFNLTIDDIVIPKYCPIFPWIELKKNDKPYANENSPTVDKIIPELGYVKNNIQIISSRANIIKSNATLRELKAFAAWVETL